MYKADKLNKLLSDLEKQPDEVLWVPQVGDSIAGEVVSKVDTVNRWQRPQPFWTVKAADGKRYSFWLMLDLQNKLASVNVGDLIALKRMESKGRMHLYKVAIEKQTKSKDTI